MLAYIDSIPEARFMAIMVAIIAAAYLLEWAFRKWCEGGKQ